MSYGYDLIDLPNELESTLDFREFLDIFLIFPASPKNLGLIIKW